MFLLCLNMQLTFIELPTGQLAYCKLLERLGQQVNWNHDFE